MSSTAHQNHAAGPWVLLTRRWIGYLTLALVFAAACTSLGFWQFGRLEEARTQMARIVANYDAVPVDVNIALPPSDGFDPDQTWLPVVGQGTYLATKELLVRSRPLDGQIGFEVLVPFQLSDGRIFIIDRGWIPSAETTVVAGVVPQPPKGLVTVVARLKPTEPALAGREATEDSVATIHLETIREIVGESTIVGAYGVLVSEDPAVSPMPTAGVKPELEEGPHLSYALQWLLFAVMGFVGLALAVRNERRIRLGLKEADNRPLVGRRRTDESEEDDIISDAMTGR